MRNFSFPVKKAVFVFSMAVFALFACSATHQGLRTYPSINHMSVPTVTQMAVRTMQLMGYELKDWNDSTGYVYGTKLFDFRYYHMTVRIITNSQGDRSIAVQCIAKECPACPSDRQVYNFYKIFDKVTKSSAYARYQQGKTSDLSIATKKYPSDHFVHETEEKPISQKWAVVIGISSYKDTRIPGLRYATRDARAFYDWLTKPLGGGYAPGRVKLLLDKSATFSNIRESLFIWLTQALEEDMVTIYFSGHGTPESPDAPQNMFLLPYDADFEKIGASGFPMWDIETALKRFVRATKVVVIADACHSGGVGSGFVGARKAIVVSPRINMALQNLTKIEDGVAVLTSGDDRQLSQESKRWGGGHGVFTWFLLKGLEGDADYSKDGKISLGELVPYVSENVRRETRNSQSPSIAGKFDPAMRIGR